MRTELHFHLLPGVDDGPVDDQEAIDLARLAVEDGTSCVVATPHVRLVEVEALDGVTARLQAVLRDAGIGLELHSGGELAPDDVGSLDQSQLELLAHGPPGARWLLLEAPLVGGEGTLQAAARELRHRGFDVLIGHPERSPATSLPTLRLEVEQGAVLQLNASSVTGDHGMQAREKALSLVRTGLPFVLASDAHSPARPPQLTAAAAVLDAVGIEDGRVRAAVDLAPGAMLRDGLSAARTARGPGPHGGRSRLGQRERATPAVARSAQIFLDRRRGA